MLKTWLEVSAETTQSVRPAQAEHTHAHPAGQGALLPDRSRWHQLSLYHILAALNAVSLPAIIAPSWFIGGVQIAAIPMAAGQCSGKQPLRGKKNNSLAARWAEIGRRILAFPVGFLIL